MSEDTTHDLSSASQEPVRRPARGPLRHLALMLAAGVTTTVLAARYRRLAHLRVLELGESPRD